MKTYIYPTYTPSRDKSGNLYIKHFHEAFEKDASYKVVNRFWQLGIASLFFNLDAELLIIQWVDLIPNKSFGKIQFLFFLILMTLARFLRKKIVWVLHNKHAHSGKSKLVDAGMKYMAKSSMVVLVHSEDGVTFFDETFPYYKGKCCYIPHPVYSSKIYETKSIEYDYIIWGGIDKRKNILEFVETAKSMTFFDDKKILICGRCSNDAYDELLKTSMNGKDNFVYINKFLSDAELVDYISKSRCILFTYNPDSMLSSGALIYSLNFCKPIIGPNVGNFRDMQRVVSCYDSFQDIPLLQMDYDYKYIMSYISNNTWDRFPQKVNNLLCSI